MEPHDEALAELTDWELTQEALAADADAPIHPDAVPFDDGRGHGADLLPVWYMPAPSVSSATRVQKVGAVVCVAAMLGVTGAGLCTTYGIPELPLW